jgi:LmbE family N-acetylglucosaminyl deacetylase
MFLMRKLRAFARELHALRAERGPYRFLVKRWDAISDIDLAVRVLGTQFFKNELVPVPLPVKKLRSILVIAPHQDDEIIGAGGSLLIASAVGVPIDVLYITDGASQRPAYAPTPTESARIRDREAQQVCSKLGATIHRLGISNTAPKPTVDDLDQLSDTIQGLKPQVVMAPWILDLPAKHRLVNHLLWLAHQRHNLPDFEIWGYQVHNDLFPNGYVDITQAAVEKRKLLECYRSQNQFYQCYEHLAMGMGAWNSRFLKESPSPRYVEIFFVLPLRELLRLVQSFYFSDLWTTYRGHRRVIQGATQIHRAALGGNPKFGSFGIKRRKR